MALRDEREQGERESGWIATRREGDCWVLALGGPWTTDTIGELDARLRTVDPKAWGSARIEMSNVETLDTAGAWVIYRTIKRLRERGLAVEVTGARESATAMLETVARHDMPCPPPARPENPLIGLVLRLGQATFIALRSAQDLVSFLGLTVTVLGRIALRPWRLRPAALFSHIERAGLDALPIVGLLSFLIGVVLAFQGAEQLERFGAEIFTVNLLAIGILREMGILITAIIVAGRSGSAFTAEIGTMKVSEEIDAMRTMGLDPVEVLVVPRTLALVIVLPLLAFYADIMGLLGGAIMCVFALDISIVQFASQFQAAVPVSNFWVGIIKAPLFAFVIALVGCFEGLRVERSAQSVGANTTRSVVESIFLVIVLDALLSVLFSTIGM
jgi:phospholipid/cholesterol/gamma-HCH transport system permease protein